MAILALMKTTLALIATLSVVVVAFGQDAVSDSMTTRLTGLSVQQQLYITWGTLVFKFASELFSSVRNGGGLKRIVTSFWFGENLPQAVASDYKKELQTAAPFPKKPTT